MLRVVFAFIWLKLVFCLWSLNFLDILLRWRLVTCLQHSPHWVHLRSRLHPSLTLNTRPKTITRQEGVACFWTSMPHKHLADTLQRTTSNSSLEADRGFIVWGEATERNVNRNNLMTGWSEIRKMLGNVSKSATNISLLLCLPAPHTHTHTHDLTQAESQRRSCL